MPSVIGVRFKNAGKLYYFDPGDLWPTAGEAVIVETARGVEYAEVVMGICDIPEDKIQTPLKKVIRTATPEDALRQEDIKRCEEEAFDICQKKIQEHGLEMKLVGVEYTFDAKKLIAYFTANGRVDFRALVKDLASVFHIRIELRQIGVRDEAKMLGGLGPCGRPLCCSKFLGDFEPVSIKMAKEQNLSLNPGKISGVCGRLMCCLKFEEDFYEQTRKKMPKVGKEVLTPDGMGTVKSINIFKETVVVSVNLDNKEDSSETREYPLEEIKRKPMPKGQKGSNEGDIE
ncbi:MAG: stage 0 sporulation family protein [Eubacteriales bacterium]|nr:stage 0 sporulation family protein [Eubacteriales bacterium]